VFAGLFVFRKHFQEGESPITQKKVLRVFSYGSFTSSYGPGPELKIEFEKKCDCIVEFIEGTDAGILLQRLKIEGEGLGADVILGLDQFDLVKARREFRWKNLNVDGFSFHPRVKSSLVWPEFVPYDWGILSFVSRKDLGNAPRELNDLLSPAWRGKFALQDPRTSSPGLQFLMWVLHEKGEKAGFEYIEKVIQNSHSVSGSWSQSYSLFQKREVDLVFSYSTSVMYHLLDENDPNYVALEFKEKHPEQFEFMAVPEYCRECDLAQEFVRFLLDPSSQTILMKRNYMFPVIESLFNASDFKLAPLFRTFSRTQLLSDTEIQRILKEWSKRRRGSE
jgi:thiamine transport system substrate-binding protein